MTEPRPLPLPRTDAALRLHAALHKRNPCPYELCSLRGSLVAIEAEASALGAAWDRAEAALVAAGFDPGVALMPGPDDTYRAGGYHPVRDWTEWTGPTPAAALAALTRALEAGK